MAFLGRYVCRNALECVTETIELIAKAKDAHILISAPLNQRNGEEVMARAQAVLGMLRILQTMLRRPATAAFICHVYAKNAYKKYMGKFAHAEFRLALALSTDLDPIELYDVVTKTTKSRTTAHSMAGFLIMAHNMAADVKKFIAEDPAPDRFPPVPDTAEMDICRKRSTMDLSTTERMLLAAAARGYGFPDVKR
jgi:hypothetical protein